YCRRQSVEAGLCLDRVEESKSRAVYGLLRFFEYIFFFQAEDGIRVLTVTGVQTCALPIFQVNGKSTEDFANYPTKLESKLAYLQNVTDSADTAPTAAEEAVFADLDQRLETQLAKWRDVLSKDVVALNDAMRKNNVALIG